MDIQGMHQLFNQILDKVGSPYFTDSEVDTFLNSSQLSILNDRIYNRKLKDKRLQVMVEHTNPMYAYENVSYSSEGIVSLEKKLENLVTGADGEVTYADMESAAGDRDIYHISSIDRKNEAGAWRYIKYRRKNDNSRLNDNSLKRSTDKFPTLQYYDDRIEIEPVAQGTEIRASVIIYPIEMDLAGGVDCELSEKTHNEIVFKALELAGVSARDQELYATVNQQTAEEG